MRDRAQGQDRARTARSDGLGSEGGTGVSRILVGVDGTAGAERALDWAVEEASLWGADVHVVQAWNAGLLPLFPPGGSGALLLEARSRVRAEEVLAQALHRVAESGGTRPPVTLQAVEGTADLVLRALAPDAQLLVVGEHPERARKRSHVGRVRPRGPCAVVVVPADRPATLPGRLLLLVDAGPAATAWARTEAAVRGWPLQILDGGTRPAGPGDVLVVEYRPTGRVRRLLRRLRRVPAGRWPCVLVQVGDACVHPGAARSRSAR